MVEIATLANQTLLITARHATQVLHFAGQEHRASGDGGTIRVYGSGPVILGPGWWDNLAIVNGDYRGPYFDGNSPGATWNGAVNDSPSTITSYTPITVPEAAGPWKSGEGHGGCRFVGNPTVINYNGVGGGQIGLSAVFQEVGAWE
ncbi:hypothetical protein SEA_JACKO_53 [Microbacterium phage Jacko]|nr:hypothetical protein SEA_JACKO_53 [Microbacterium phage Jacko]